jgi:hypothetical protein
MKVRCDHCGKPTEKEPGHVNRSRKLGMKLFCGFRCFGLSRRKHKTKAQKIEEKRLYDVEYRRKNLAKIKANKKAYFQRTYDPVKAAVERKKRAKFHAEYCRRPSYRLWKREYDRRRRDGMYGAFAEAARLTIELNREIKERATNEQIKIANGTWSKPQHRRRADKAPERTRPRNQDRRDRHTAIVGG